MTDFFRINLPYGIARNAENEWIAFNREYLPIGFNTSEPFSINGKSNYPIHTLYKGLTETLLIKIAGKEFDSIRRNDKGEIITVFFYNDRSNPTNQKTNNASAWENYFSKIQALSKLQIK